MSARTPFLVALAVAALVLIVFATVELSTLLAYVPSGIEGGRA